MLKSFKSSPLVMFSSFIKPVIPIGALTFALLLAPDASAYLFYIIAADCVLVGLLAYISFYAHNIVTEITDSEIRFKKGGKVYLNLPFDAYEFTSYVLKHSINGIPTFTDRFLRAIPRSGNEHKDCRCYNFDRSTFETFIACASRPFTQGASVGVPVYGPENPVEFTVNKQALVDHYKKQLIILLAITAVFLVPIFIINSVNAFSLCFAILITSFFLAVHLPLVIKITKNTPEVITISKEYISIGDERFYYDKVELIKLTPPSYSGRSFALPIFGRRLSVVCNNETCVFIVDSGKNDVVFADYEGFCAEIERIFTNKPERFMYELG